MKKPDFLTRPLDYTRTPRESKFMQEEHRTAGHSVDRLVFMTCVFAAGFVAGMAVTGAL